MQGGKSSSFSMSPNKVVHKQSREDSLSSTKSPHFLETDVRKPSNTNLGIYTNTANVIEATIPHRLPNQYTQRDQIKARVQLFPQTNSDSKSNKMIQIPGSELSQKVATTSPDIVEPMSPIVKKKYNIEDFEIVRELGRGSFGQVNLVKHK